MDFLEKFKPIIDLSAWSIIGATMVQWLPPIAAIIAIAWHITQFYDRWKKKKKD